MNPQQFVEKWRPVALSERAAAQSHFRDLCQLFEHPDPIAADPLGEWFTFEKGVPKSGGGDGFADVWKRSHFAWEYKKKRKNLDDALGQLARYALALESPPLHIVCDTDRFRIVTAWTNSVPRSYDIGLEDILDPAKRGWLEAAFYKPERLRPGGLRADLTKAAADKFSTIATSLRSRGNSAVDVAHFVNRLAFLFFAEDVKLLPDGYFRRVLREIATQPHISKQLLDEMFMVLQKGGRFGVDRLPHVNGGLFDDKPSLALNDSELSLLIAAGSEDWAHIDPSIFGTLFERFLDPDKRAQIGAHYTDAEKIMKIINPVIMEPLNAEWARAKIEIEKLTDKARKKGSKAKEWRAAEEKRSIFLERLRNLKILDPACGSGNFLYLALHAIKDLELTVNLECEVLDLAPHMPTVGPEVLCGIEINPLAAELARTAVWIGDIQWSIRNGFNTRPEPILRRLDAIECRDALIDTEGSPAEWPRAEFIVGNPPFLGVKKMIAGLGEDYVSQLRLAYKDVISPFSDIVCWWFAIANKRISEGSTRYAGFVSTDSIRGGRNRLVLDQISKDNNIYDAWSSEPWVLDGASVKVSLICFSRKNDATDTKLNGSPVQSILADLTPEHAFSKPIYEAVRLKQNSNISFMATIKAGAFDLDGDTARKWLAEPLNVNGKANSDVIKRWINGMSVVRRPEEMWVIDYGAHLSEVEASHYEKPFAHVKTHVYPQRALVRKKQYRDKWWLFAEPCGGMRRALSSLSRYIVTPTISKYRVFAWADKNMLADHALIAFAREDDVSFGILHSKFHEAWSLRLGTSLEDRPRYTPTTTFETFPFPEGLEPNICASKYANDPRAMLIAAASKELDRLRTAWLNPPDLVKIEREVCEGYPDRILARNAEAAKKLRDRTLTNLYNLMPDWLKGAHAALDAAVAKAYGWPTDISMDEALIKLKDLNAVRALGSSSALPVTLPLTGNGVRQRRVGRHQVLDAVALATVVLSPSHLTSIEAEVGAADAVVDAHLGAAQA